MPPLRPRTSLNLARLPGTNCPKVVICIVEKSIRDANPPIARRLWEHHHFNLWEHLIVYRILPHFNDFDGLHVAGDWTQSVGQEAA